MDVASLLEVLREAGASDAVAVLATRAATHVSLDHPRAISMLLMELREAGASDAATNLLAYAANAGIPSIMLEDPRTVNDYWQGREPDDSPSQWTWHEPPQAEH
jgi:hypothetical protein